MRTPADKALFETGFEPITLIAKEGPAMINGTQASTALSLAGLFEAERVRRFAHRLVDEIDVRARILIIALPSCQPDGNVSREQLLLAEQPGVLERLEIRQVTQSFEAESERKAFVVT